MLKAHLIFILRSPYEYLSSFLRYIESCLAFLFVFLSLKIHFQVTVFWVEICLVPNQEKDKLETRTKMQTLDCLKQMIFQVNGQFNQGFPSFSPGWIFPNWHFLSWTRILISHIPGLFKLTFSTPNQSILNIFFLFFF